MNKSTDDIASQFEADLAKFSTPPVAQPEAALAVAVTAEQSTAAVQAALALELLLLDSAHDELIQHYMPLNNVKASLA